MDLQVGTACIGATASAPFALTVARDGQQRRCDAVLAQGSFRAVVWCLPPGGYTATVESAESSRTAAVDVAAVHPRSDLALSLVGPLHAQTVLEAPRLLLPFILDAPGDVLWAPASIAALTASHVAGFFALGLFVLPSDGVLIFPNGQTRFCIDLSQPLPWLQSRKLRRAFASVSFTMDRDFPGALRAAQQYHADTWLTDEFVAALIVFAATDAGAVHGLRLHSFELWDNDTGSLAAATLGFSVGRVYHDFSMCTPLRDERSCGTLLTKLVGATLQRCGFQLWYWGNALGYMAQYSGRYGGVDLPRSEFYERWMELVTQAPVADLAEDVRVSHFIGVDEDA